MWRNAAFLTDFSRRKRHGNARWAKKRPLDGGKITSTKLGCRAIFDSVIVVKGMALPQMNNSLYLTARR
jgi:hypothetical protein